MTRRIVGPKGQVVIPDSIRKALGIKPGSKVAFEVRDEKIVITPDLKPSEFIENYTRTYAKKLRKQVDVKKVIEEEVAERIGLS
jgi:AbrB family looped-hinge helix DNA binding protein